MHGILAEWAKLQLIALLRENRDVPKFISFYLKRTMKRDVFQFLIRPFKINGYELFETIRIPSILD